MRHNGILVLVALLALLGGAMWLLQTRDGGPSPDEARAAATNGATAAMGAKGLPAADVPGDVEGLDTRVAVAGDARRGGPYAIVGRVVGVSGGPIEGAVVAGRPAFGRSGRTFEEWQRDWVELGGTTTTGADGAFRLVVGGRSIEIELQVRVRGHVMLERSFLRPVAADVDAGTLRVEPGAVISGRVLDPGGRPVEGARVLWEPDRPRPFGDMVRPSVGSEVPPEWSGGATTDTEGRFELVHVAPGEVALRVRHDAHPPAARSLTVGAGEHVEDVVVSLEVGASITGRVLGLPDGTAHVHVLAAERQPSGRETRPDVEDLARAGFGDAMAAVESDGRFLLRGLRPGRRYVLHATRVAVEMLFTMPLLCSQPVEVAAGAAGVELHYEAGVSVTFSVVDDESGEPIERLFVEAHLERQGRNGTFFEGPGVLRRTEWPDGRVKFEGLRVERDPTLVLGVTATGHEVLVRRGIRLPLAGNLDLGTLRLARAPVVEVSVTEASTGAPVAGAEVTLDGAVSAHRTGVFVRRRSSSATTGDDGTCTLNAPAEESVAVVIRSAGRAPYRSESLQVPRSGRLLHHAVLWRGGTVEVRVRNVDGDPVTQGAVEHEAPDDARARAMLDAEGVARFVHLAPGSHRFRLERDLGQGGGGFYFAGGLDAREHEPWTTVDVEDGGRHELVLEKAPAASLTGVVRENGLPLANASIVLERSRGGAGEARGLSERRRRTTTDSNGAYTLTDVEPGEHRLWIRHESRAMPASTPVSVVLGDNRFDCELEVTVLRGTVRDARGQPIAGARVEVGRAEAAPRPAGPELVVQLEGWRLGSSPRAHTVTAVDGSYELRGVEAGVALLVRARASGSLPGAAAPVEVQAGSVLDGVDLVLEDAGRIAVRAPIEPGGLATATFLEEGDAVEPVRARLRDGTAVLEELRPGRWRVALARRDLPGAVREVEVVAGRTVELRF